MTQPDSLPPCSRRRRFLKAAGVAIALPTLESFGMPTLRPNKKPQMRLVCVASALGMNPEAFFPSKFGTEYELSPSLKSLEPLKQDFTVFSHMDHPSIFTKHGSMSSPAERRESRSRRAG